MGLLGTGSAVPPSWIRGLEFTRDGKALWSVGSNGLLRRLNADPDSWVERARVLAARGFDPEEANLVGDEGTVTAEDDPGRPASAKATAGSGGGPSAKWDRR
jgi:hypothetical protein